MAVIKKWNFNISDKKSQWHLPQRIKEHKGTAINKQPEGSAQCIPKWHCAEFENFKKVPEQTWLPYFWNTFLIKELKPILNKQCDSICSKLFV